jgi:hypothetical protein
MKWIQCGANLRAFSLSRHRALHFLIPVREALPQCLLRGFLWWKPLKEKLNAEEPAEE